MKIIFYKLGFFILLCLAHSLSLAGDFKLHRYVAETWHVNSYWLESDTGIVLIDAQLLRSDAKLLATLIKSTGKPLMGTIITHPHGDHIGGLNVLRQELGQFPIITTQKTADAFKSAHANTMSFGFEDFDSVLVEANQIVEDGQTIELAGIKLVIDDIGPGESVNSILIYQPDRNILFTGDATMHAKHFYLGDGFSKGALWQHRYIKKTYKDVKVLYPGHGDPAGPSSVLKPEIAYIKFQRSLVKEALKNPANIKKDGSGFKDGTVKKTD